MGRRFGWTENDEQRVWLWIGLAFALFYWGEAVLFWGSVPRFSAPPGTPLAYWGAFGATIIWLIKREKKDVSSRPSPRAPHGWAATIPGIGITMSVVGMPYIVIGLTHNVTLGHVILLGAMFEAGVVIGGLTGSLGWIAASLVWAASGMFILYHPQGQDYTLGFALAVGFILVGLLRRCFCDEEPPNVSEAVGAGGASRAGEGPREASSGRS